MDNPGAPSGVEQESAYILVSAVSPRSLTRITSAPVKKNEFSSSNAAETSFVVCSSWKTIPNANHPIVSAYRLTADYTIILSRSPRIMRPMCDGNDGQRLGGIESRRFNPLSGSRQARLRGQRKTANR